MGSISVAVSAGVAAPAGSLEDTRATYFSRATLCIASCKGSIASREASAQRAVAAMAPDTMEFTIYDGLAALPHFNPDLDGDDAPAPVAHLRGLLQATDGVLICTPEYAFGVPGALKNALDWTVSSGEFAGKPVAAISASPGYMGGDKAHASLLLTLTAEAARIVDGGTLVIPAVRRKLAADGDVSDPTTARALRSVLAALARADSAR